MKKKGIPINKIWLLLLFVSFDITTTAFADQTITMKQCIEHAVSKYPLSLESTTNAQAYKMAYKSKFAGLLPSFNLSAAYGKAYGYDVAVTNGGIASLQAIAQVDLFNPTRWFESSRSKMSYEAQKYYQHATENEIAYSVKSAYTEALFYNQEIMILQENIHNLGVYLSLAKRLLSSGLVTENDVLRTQIELDAAKANLQNSILNKHAQLNILTSLTGIPMTDGVNLKKQSATFTAPANVERINTDTFSGNPTLQAIDYEERAEKYRVQSAKSQYLPVLSLEADVGWLGESFPAAVDQYRGYSYFATLNFPLFRWGEIGYNVEKASLLKNTIHYKKALFLNELTLSYHNTIGALQNAIERITLYKRDISIAKQNFDYSEARYSGGGRIGSYEVLLDQQLLKNAQLALAIAQKDFYLALFKIQLLRGKIYE